MDDCPTPQRPARTHSMGMRVLYRRFARETQAGPIVEFAIIVPVLLLLLLGVVDFGRAFFQQNSLVSAAREGARFGAVQGNLCDAGTVTNVRGRVVLYFSSVGGAAPANNATAIPVTVEPVSACPSTPNAVTSVKVRIANYAFTPITPFFRLLNQSGTLNLSATAVYRWERSP